MIPPRAKRYQGRLPIVDSEGRPTAEFLRTLNANVDIVNAIAEAQAAAAAANAAAGVAQAAATTAQTAAEGAQTAADNAQATSDSLSAEQSINTSYPTNYAPPLLSATNLGDVTIASHDRVYGNPPLNPTVALAGDTIATGFVTGDRVVIYYLDPTRAGGAVTYQASLDDADAAQTGDTHSVGVVIIPGVGSDDGFPVLPPGGVYA